MTNESLPARSEPPAPRGRLLGAMPSLSALLVIVAIALGVFFRFYGLGQKLVWHDEVSTRILAGGHVHDEWKATLYTGRVIPVADVKSYQHDNPERSVLETIKGLAQDDPQHPPLYYVLARLWIGAVGDGIGTLRALSALLSLLCFPAIFWMAKEIFRSSRVAWTSVALAAVSPLLVLYAQEAREYALWAALMLLASAALLYAVRLTEDSAPIRRLARAWGAYGAVTVLGFYTSFSTASVIAAHIVFLIVRERGRLTRVAKASVATLALAALLFLPWALTLLRHYEAFAISMKWSREIVIPPPSLLGILTINASRIALDLWREPQGVVAWLAITPTLVLLVWAVARASRRAPNQAGLLVGALLVVPLALLLVPDLLFGGIRSVSARYLLPSWLALEVALAFLLASGSRSPRVARFAEAAFGAVLAVGVASCIGNARQVTVWTKGISYELPTVAAHINRAAHPLVVGNMEKHHPGNLMALANLLEPRAQMQFLRPEMEQDYVLPPAASDVFLMSPTIQFRQSLEAREHVHTRLIFKDTYLELWAVEPAS